MRTIASSLALIGVISCSADAATHQVTLNGQTFTLPRGFTIELAAGPSVIKRPITAAFDELGRLYVAESSGSSEKVAVQLQKKPHRIVRLEDTNGDGRFNKRTVFADRMMFPEGTMWYRGSLYVAAPPSIWKLTDTTGDGKADKREEWFQGKTLTGCANDLHGPYRGPDGWIYWCKGAFAKQTYPRKGKPPFVTRASHIFRARPDGSGIEAVTTGGMDNPVDVVFNSAGEKFFTSTFLQHPRDGKRDGLGHAVYGAIHGKDHGPIYEHPWTGPQLMPIMTHLGPAAPCGLVCYQGEAFGKRYADNLFACCFNLRKVTRHELIPHGATYRTRDEDFVVSDNLDFHPTDVIEDADGSLLVCDTGGWYKLCCPTSQLVKPDVTGAIYRIRRVGAKPPTDPRGLKIAWKTLSGSELVRLLDDKRPAVRERAIETQALAGDKSITALRAALADRSAVTRSNAIWTLSRIDSPTAREAVRVAVSDSDEAVRSVAVHVISAWRDRQSRQQLIRLLKHSSVSTRRVAAEALGRVGTAADVPALLTAAGKTDDPTLQHSLIYALIEIGNQNTLGKGRAHRNPRVRRAAAIAIEQMPGGKLEPAVALSLLKSSVDENREAAEWMLKRHPEWGRYLAQHFRERLTQRIDADEIAELAAQLASFTGTAEIQKLLATPLTQRTPNERSCRVVLMAMAISGRKTVPAAWGEAITPHVVKGSPLLPPSLVTASQLRWGRRLPPKLRSALLTLAKTENIRASHRLLALSTVANELTVVPPQVFDFLKTRLHRDRPLSERGTAADVLARANLAADQLIDLASSLDSVAPTEINRVLAAFEKSPDPKVGTSLANSLKSARAFSSVRFDQLQRSFKRFGKPLAARLAELSARLNVDRAQQQKRLGELVESLPKGDVRRGQLVFNSNKTSCAACHAIGYRGGRIGPDLTRIGRIRSKRDLLESILYPSSSITQSYESWRVRTTGGKSFSGLLRRHPGEIEIVIDAQKKTRVREDEVDSLRPSHVSIMPGGIEKLLSRQQLADLVAFLRACK